jgi:hypothetical protein
MDQGNLPLADAEQGLQSVSRRPCSPSYRRELRRPPGPRQLVGCEAPDDAALIARLASSAVTSSAVHCGYPYSRSASAMTAARPMSTSNGRLKSNPPSSAESTDIDGASPSTRRPPAYQLCSCGPPTCAGGAPLVLAARRAHGKLAHRPSASLLAGPGSGPGHLGRPRPTRPHSEETAGQTRRTHDLAASSVRLRRAPPPYQGRRLLLDSTHHPELTPGEAWLKSRPDCADRRRRAGADMDRTRDCRGPSRTACLSGPCRSRLPRWHGAEGHPCQRRQCAVVIGFQAGV